MIALVGAIASAIKKHNHQSRVHVFGTKTASGFLQRHPYIDEVAITSFTKAGLDVSQTIDVPAIVKGSRSIVTTCQQQLGINIQNFEPHLNFAPGTISAAKKIMPVGKHIYTDTDLDLSELGYHTMREKPEWPVPLRVLLMRRAVLVVTKTFDTGLLTSISQRPTVAIGHDLKPLVNFNFTTVVDNDDISTVLSAARGLL